MHRCRTDKCQNERRTAWEHVFLDFRKHTQEMDPPKWPQTVYFKRFGTFDVFLVYKREGDEGGADARTHARTDARTDAGSSRSAPEPPPQRAHEQNTPFGAHPLTPMFVTMLSSAVLAPHLQGRPAVTAMVVNAEWQCLSLMLQVT